MKLFINLFIITLLAAVVNVSAQEKSTLKFAEKDGQELFLDHYKAAVEGERPCVIFVFGGGFARGERVTKTYSSYFNMLLERGYDVVSIDYRLGYSSYYDNIDWGWKYYGAIKRFISSIDWAVEDLTSATRFVLDHAEEWNIDTKRIIVSGSSAGAITSLQTEYYITNKDSRCAELGDFNYQAVIAFAGALFSTSGLPKYSSDPCPMMFFHGSADHNVAYDKKSLFGIGLFGPDEIVKQLDERGIPYYFYDALYRDHKMATEPMKTHHKEISEFLDIIENGKLLQVRNKVFDMEKERFDTNVSIFDFLSHDYRKE